MLMPPYRMRTTNLASETIDQLAAFRERVVPPRHRALVDLVIEHIRCESVNLDLDGVMATMVLEPEFHYHGANAGPPVIGREAVRSMYERLIAAGPHCGGVEIERCFIDDDALVLEGLIVMKASYVLADVAQIGGEIDPSREPYIRQRAITMFPFVDGKMTGEHFYLDAETRIVYID